MAQIIYNPDMFNPLFWHLLRYMNDKRIRYIYIEGGSSASKTMCICQAIYYELMRKGINTMVYRQFGVHIKDTVYMSFKKAADLMEMRRYLEMLEMKVRYPYKDKMVRFRGLDDTESLKGLEDYDIVYCNEWNQQSKDIWDQLRKRLRGKENQKYICDWNPVSSQLWQYTEWIDIDEWIDLPLYIDDAPTKYSSLNEAYSWVRINKAGNSIWIKITYRDNFYIVGHPNGKGGYYDEHTLADYEYDRIHNPNLYRIYANGERGIIRTGGEFWKQFDENKHVKPIKYKPGAIHLSLDENVNPYITVAVWQVFPKEKEISQIHELPCKAPINNAPKAAKRTADYLRSIGHEDVVFVYGDPSVKRRSTVDENNRSFYDKFIEVMKKEGFTVINRVGKSYPQVALSAAFINDIYESNLFGWSIIISDACKISIDDYATVKEDVDGSMKKPKEKDKVTEVTYEPHGHFSDAKRYFIIKILEDLFRQYKSKRKGGSGSIAVKL